MIPKANTIAIMSGQSNSRDEIKATFAQLCGRNLLAIAQRAHGGEAIANWVSGTAGTHARAANYLSDFFDAANPGIATLDAMLVANPTATKISLLWIQGENDAANSTTPQQVYTDRLNAMRGFLEADSGLEVEIISALIWDTDATLANPTTLAGYTAIRAALVAASDATYETSDLTRADTVHIDFSQMPECGRRIARTWLPRQTFTLA